MRAGLCCFVLLSLLGACGGDQPAAPRLSLSGLLAGDGDDGFARAEVPREFHFPDDHGAHRDYRNEWWYVTGNVRDEDGAAYGYQLTFFRRALPPVAIDSPWAAPELWMAHAAVSDLGAGRHLRAERFSRAGPGLAGAALSPLRVWLHDWQLRGRGNDFPWQLSVATEHFALELELEPLKPLVLQGEAGLSRKSAAPGNASYYYSLTRLQTQGRLKLAGQWRPVSGLSWLDREWGSSSLGADQVGWDWFALQLNSGEELMYYQLRDRAGRPHRFSRGSWVNAGGTVTPLLPAQIQLTPLRWWRAPDGRRYPVQWRLQFPSGERGPWTVSALLDTQYMDLSVRYWEGAVEVRAADGTALGRGYLEMTGYD